MPIHNTDYDAAKEVIEDVRGSKPGKLKGPPANVGPAIRIMYLHWKWAGMKNPKSISTACTDDWGYTRIQISRLILLNRANELPKECYNHLHTNQGCAQDIAHEIIEHCLWFQLTPEVKLWVDALGERAIQTAINEISADPEISYLIADKGDIKKEYHEGFKEIHRQIARLVVAGAIAKRKKAVSKAP